MNLFENSVVKRYLRARYAKVLWIVVNTIRPKICIVYDASSIPKSLKMSLGSEYRQKSWSHSITFRSR